jgi:hypothetical protein
VQLVQRQQQPTPQGAWSAGAQPSLPHAARTAARQGAMHGGMTSLESQRASQPASLARAPTCSLKASVSGRSATTSLAARPQNSTGSRGLTLASVTLVLMPRCSENTGPPGTSNRAHASCGPSRPPPCARRAGRTHMRAASHAAWQGTSSSGPNSHQCQRMLHTCSSMSASLPLLLRTL